MDVSVLREEYRSSRERRRRHTQVLLFRTGERKRRLIHFLFDFGQNL